MSKEITILDHAKSKDIDIIEKWILLNCCNDVDYDQETIKLIAELGAMTNGESIIEMSFAKKDSADYKDLFTFYGTKSLKVFADELNRFIDFLEKKI